MTPAEAGAKRTSAEAASQRLALAGLALSDDARMAVRVHGLPGLQVDADVPERLGVARSPRDGNVQRHLTDETHATAGSLEELSEVIDQLLIRNSNTHSRRCLRYPHGDFVPRDANEVTADGKRPAGSGDLTSVPLEACTLLSRTKAVLVQGDLRRAGVERVMLPRCGASLPLVGADELASPSAPRGGAVRGLGVPSRRDGRVVCNSFYEAR
jgi:hypothetical protein